MESPTTQELFVRRLETLDSSISGTMSAIYKASLGIPAVGVALLALVERDRPRTAVETLSLAYAGLVLLSTLVTVYAVRQMVSVFVLAGQRQAIEEFAEEQAILPSGLYSWERGPAHEISGAIRLDGHLNWGRYIEPGLAGALNAAIGGVALYRLQEFGVARIWFIGAAVSLVIGLMLIALSFRAVPAVQRRVHEWTLRELSAPKPKA